jgi:hypothetical protein
VNDETPLRTICETYGVFLRREANELVWDDRALRAARRAGQIVRVRQGAYVFGDTWAPMTPEQRHLTLVRAVMRLLGPRAVVSHHSAALLHGLHLWGVDLGRAHVTRVDSVSGRTTPDSVHHEGLCLDTDLEVVDGLSTTSAVRAALESATLSDIERGLVVVDSGLRSGCFDKETLTRQHTLMEEWPGTRHLQVVARLADGGAGSVGESRTRYFFWSNALPMPELQHEVWLHGELIGVLDFYWPEWGLMGEFDGKVKYLAHLREGEGPEDAVFREKQREDLLRRVTGCRMVRFVWSDLERPGRTLAWLRPMLGHGA